MHAGSVPVDTPAFILGWGAQNNTHQTQAVTRLKGLNTTISSCSEGTSPKNLHAVAGKWDQGGQPWFICLAAPAALGGPCYGDSGGEYACQHTGATLNPKGDAW